MGVKQLVSNSEIQTYKRCKRKWWIVFWAKLLPAFEPKTGPRAVGTLVHVGLKVMYEGGDTWREVLERIHAHDREIPDVDLKKLESEYELAVIMLEGYEQYVTEEGIDEDIELVASETEIEVPLEGTNILLAGKLDQRILRRSDGARRFLDFKTVGDLTSPRKTLHADEQMLTYELLEMLDMKSRGDEGERTDGGIYRMLRKVKRTVRAKPPFYDSVEVRHSLEWLRSFWLRTWGTIQDILELRGKLDAGADHRQVAYPTWKGTCSWDCDYVHICPLLDQGHTLEGVTTAKFITGDPYERYNQTPQEEAG